MTLEQLKEKINSYFRSKYNAIYFDQTVIDVICKDSLEENIDTLLTRDANLCNRIQQLEELQKQYNEDARKAYKDAFDKYSVILKEGMTKKKALEVLGGMTLNDIILLEEQDH